MLINELEFQWIGDNFNSKFPVLWRVGCNSMGLNCRYKHLNVGYLKDMCRCPYVNWRSYWSSI